MSWKTKPPIKKGDICRLTGVISRDGEPYFLAKAWLKEQPFKVEFITQREPVEHTHYSVVGINHLQGKGALLYEGELELI